MNSGAASSDHVGLHSGLPATTYAPSPMAGVKSLWEKKEYAPTNATLFATSPGQADEGRSARQEARTGRQAGGHAGGGPAGG